jgi:hypothetical protein
MRSALALTLLIAFCVSADAATARHLQRTLPHRVIIHPSRGMTGPVQFAVPGWSNEQTQYWLDSATSCAGCG